MLICASLSLSSCWVKSGAGEGVVMKYLKLWMEGSPPAWVAAVLKEMISVSKTHKPRMRIGVFEAEERALGYLGQRSGCWVLGPSVATLLFTHVEGAVFTLWLLVFSRCCSPRGRLRFDLWVLVRPFHQQSPQSTALGSEQWLFPKSFQTSPKKLTWHTIFATAAFSQRLETCSRAARKWRWVLHHLVEVLVEVVLLAAGIHPSLTEIS